jgi:hypothetical protein
MAKWRRSDGQVLNLNGLKFDIDGDLKAFHFLPLLLAPPFLSSLGFSFETSAFLSFFSTLVSLDLGFSLFSSLGETLLPFDLSVFLKTFSRSLTIFQSASSIL